MAFEYIMFHDASVACKKTYLEMTSSLTLLNFPKLTRTKDPRRDPSMITPNQRQTSHFNSKRKKRTFSQTVINEPTRKRIIHQSGYDKKAHNEVLNSPNGRIQNANSSASCSTFMPSTSRNTYNLDSDNSLTHQIIHKRFLVPVRIFMNPQI